MGEGPNPEAGGEDGAPARGPQLRGARAPIRLHALRSGLLDVRQVFELLPTLLGAGRAAEVVEGYRQMPPLGEAKTAVMMTGHLPISLTQGLGHYFLGNMPGSLGEVSAAALLLGAAYLFWRKVLTWHIPVSYLGTVVLFSGAFWLVDPGRYPNPLFQLLTGGLILGAFFMATDMVTSPITSKGMLLFGVGCGVITVLIRLFGGYPEGVSFAILLMNALTPLIDRFTRPKVFGLNAARA